MKRLEILLSGVMSSGARELLMTGLDVVVLMTRRNKRPELAEISTEKGDWFDESVGE